jgi:hypothetical protein
MLQLFELLEIMPISGLGGGLQVSRIFEKTAIRMVAGLVEVTERKEILVAGVGFEPTTSGL